MKENGAHSRVLLKRTIVVGILGVSSIALTQSCGTPQAEDLRSISGSLDQFCASAAPAQTFVSSCNVTSPQTYPPDCFKGYVVQVNQVASIPSGTGGAPYAKFEWAGEVLNTQQACEDAWVGGYVFEKQSDGRFAAQDFLFSPGTWSGTGGTFACSPPKAQSFKVAQGGDYKFAASARTQTTSSAPTRPVHIVVSQSGQPAP